MHQYGNPVTLKTAEMCRSLLRSWFRDRALAPTFLKKTALSGGPWSPRASNVSPNSHMAVFVFV